MTTLPRREEGPDVSDCEACYEAYEFQCNLCVTVFCLDHASKHACPVLARLPAHTNGYRKQRRKHGYRAWPGRWHCNGSGWIQIVLRVPLTSNRLLRPIMVAGGGAVPCRGCKRCKPEKFQPRVGRDERA